MTGRNTAEISARYIRFAKEEARGRSPLYAELATGVAGDRDVIEFLQTMPPAKQQPNLLFAAVRYLLGTVPDWPQFRSSLLEHAGSLRSVMLAHSTQTNEPARCALLLPLLARLPQPLALVEVGASAGLCLLLDHYAYTYEAPCRSEDIRGAWNGEGAQPIFTCKASRAVPLPTHVPQISWRAGLDLNPIDVTNRAQAEWLEALVWPEQTSRLANLRKALGIAASRPPRIVKGDLLGARLAQLCSEAPTDATLVIFHTAVLAYVEDLRVREDFAQSVKHLCNYWVSNESPRVFPSIAASARSVGEPGQFLMSVNGAPVAWTDPHGAAIEWIAVEDAWRAHNR